MPVSGWLRAVAVVALALAAAVVPGRARAPLPRAIMW